MKTRKVIAFLMALAMAFALAACTQNAPAEEPAAEPETEAAEPVAVTDLIGREIEIVPGSYERIVCIGAGALRMYSYVGDVSLLCGVEDIDNLSLQERPKMFDGVARPYMLAYGEEFKALPSCGVGGPNAQAAEAEKILSCDPDLVISEYEDVEKEDALQEQLGVPVVTLKAGPGAVFDDAFAASMRLLGTVLGEEERAEALVSFVEGQKAEISSRTAAVSEDEKPAAYICGLGNWGTTDHLMTSPNYVSFKTANVKNVLSSLNLENPAVQPIEKETFVALGKEMDVLVMDAAAVKNIKPLYAEDPAMFDECKAWNDGEVYLEMAYNAYYTNYEISLINTWFIAKSVYPDLFADVDMTEKTNEVTQAFFGLDLADEIASAPASYGGYQKIDTKTFFE